VLPFFKFEIADFSFFFASKTALSRIDLGVSKIHFILDEASAGVIRFRNSSLL
jgi:hypothetical protein